MRLTHEHPMIRTTGKISKLSIRRCKTEKHFWYAGRRSEIKTSNMRRDNHSPGRTQGIIPADDAKGTRSTVLRPPRPSAPDKINRPAEASVLLLTPSFCFALRGPGRTKEGGGAGRLVAEAVLVGPG